MPSRQKGEVGVWLYPFSTPALEGGWAVGTMLCCFTSQKRPGTHWTGGGIGLGASVDLSRKSCLHWGLNPAICNWHISI